MILLCIDTSCDDTAAAVVKDGRQILSNVVSSQVEFHKKYGGVVPEIASRRHQEQIMPVICEALAQAGLDLEGIEGVAVTQGPGLVGSLLVGVNAAKAIAYARGLPLAGVNHLEGHLLSALLEHRVPSPNVTMVVSGGHTNLYCVRAVGDYRLLGRTLDDAAGEAFDKVAKLLDLGYPGGVVIDRLAKGGRADAIAFPRPMLHEPGFDFSFSGLKTAVLYHVKKAPAGTLSDAAIRDIVASFQAAVVDILVEKTIQAALRCEAAAITIAGGVASNSLLRAQIQSRAREANLPVFIPSPQLCTDNAAMIAVAAEQKISQVHEFPYSMNAISRWQIGT
jgi:N6-L-threonylcarbamoyladenine synthase